MIRKIFNQHTGQATAKQWSAQRRCLAGLLAVAFALLNVPFAAAQISVATVTPTTPTLPTPATGSVLTVARLRNDPELTPEKFMSYFRDFKFQLGEKVQAPDVFLARRTGDCDDFATLAADILREKKYTTRLIAIFMKQETHVVCYVEEIKGYLDFNNRQRAVTIEPTNGSLEDIADKVAAWFRSPWHCVSEFTYEGTERRFDRIAFR